MVWQENKIKRRQALEEMPIETIEDAVARVKQAISDEGIDWVTRICISNSDEVIVISPTYKKIVWGYRIWQESYLKSVVGGFKLTFMQRLI